MKGMTIIASLPRSRTAWLSAWLCTGQCWAWHDAIGSEGWLMVNPADYVAKLTSRPEPWVVDVSSAIPMFPDHVQTSGARVLWVERNAAECRASWLKYVKDHFPDAEARWDGMIAAAAKFRDEFSPLAVPFEDLDKEDTLRLIWNECAPTIEFDVERARAFKRLNIQEII